MAMNKRYDGAIEALDASGKIGSAAALSAIRLINRVIDNRLYPIVSVCDS
jgi:hypothetical protein